jgi:hypothetical protein
LLKRIVILGGKGIKPRLHDLALSMGEKKTELKDKLRSNFLKVSCS